MHHPTLGEKYFIHIQKHSFCLKENKKNKNDKDKKPTAIQQSTEMFFP